MDRREFLKTSTLGIMGGLITVGTSYTFGQSEAERKSMRWAFFADTHIPEVDDSNDPPRGPFFYDPHGNLRTVVSQVLAASPAAAVIAGDLARLTGEVGDYASFKPLVRPLTEKMPVFMALGNHDDRDNFHSTFSNFPGQKQPVRDKHVTVVNAAPIRLIVLDSLFYVDETPGLLGRAQRQWLEEYLNESDDTPTIIFVHHTLQDSDGALLDVPRLFRIIEPSRKVKAIVYGHSHRFGYTEHQGIHLINLPATGYSFNPNNPIGWLDAKLTAKGGEFTLHVIGGNKEVDASVTKLNWRV